MRNEQSPDEPDEFGLKPPKNIEPSSEDLNLLRPSLIEPDSLPPFIISEPSEYIAPKEYIHDRSAEYWLPRDINRNNLISRAGMHGAGIVKDVPPTIEKEPTEKLDPYPSREGWRANYLTPHDPFAEEPADKPKGKIGTYDIIETTVTFDDVGGNASAKELLIEIAAQLEEPDLYKEWDVPVPKGVLLHGVPGTGKTLLAKAFANRAKAAFVEVSVASIRSAYHGESEKNLDTLFKEAREYGKPVVIFFDEINALLPDRSGMVANHPDSKLVDTFLQAMDGMQSAENIMVLGATNFPGRLDPAAVRPGRFDHKVEVELPDIAGCREIVAKQLLGAERRSQKVMVDDVLDLEIIAQWCEGLSGADIKEILNRVKRTMVQTKRAMGTTNLPGGLEFNDEDRTQMCISTDDIVAAAINYQLHG